MSRAEGANPVAVVRMQMDQMDGEFRNALPAHIPVERFKRVAMTAIQNNPDLINADRRSLFNSAMRAAQDGLLPDGREGAIVVYRSKSGPTAQWMPMVHGIMKKVRNSGEIATFVARVVYEGDKFRYWVDEDGEHITYEPADDPNTDKVIRVFAMAKTKDGELYVEPMTLREVEKVRQASRAKDSGPWKDWWEEMAKKTAIRRLAKRLPMSTDLDDLIRRDDALYDMSGAGDARVKGAATVRPQVIDGGKPASLSDIARGHAAPQLTAAQEIDDEIPDHGEPQPDPAAEATSAPQADDQADQATDTAEGEQASPDAAQDDAEVAPDEVQIEAAYKRGKRSGERGMRGDSVPPDIKNDPVLADAWRDGWAAGSTDKAE